MKNIKKIALVCIAKSEDLYLQEWIDYHLKLGFDDIHIFQNNWRFKEVITNERVYFHEWDFKSRQNEEPIWVNNIQARCYTEFSKNYYEEYEWAAFFDVDEFLVLKKNKDVIEFIRNYDNVECLIVNWAFFGDNGIKEFDEKETSVIDRFTKRQRDPSPQFKSICKLGPDMKHQVHWTTGIWTDTHLNTGNTGYNKNASLEIAQLNHYFSKTFPEFVSKVERGNACGSGNGGKRDLSDFETGNYNEIEDLTAKEFFSES